MRRLEAGLWVGEDPQYPRVVFDSIKDNPSFVSAIESSASKRHITWFMEYLSFIKDPSIHSHVCLKMLSFLCEELQHERFSDLRPTIMDFAAAVSSLFDLQFLFSYRNLQLLKSEDMNAEYRVVVSEAFKVHGPGLISVAFRSIYAHAKWAEPRNQTRALLEAVMLHDMNAITSGFATLCTTLGGRRPPASLTLGIRDHIWRAVYEALESDDSDGIHVIISVMSQGSHLSDLHKDAFRKVFAVTGMREFYNLVNAGIQETRSGFADAISAYCTRTSSSSILSILQMPGTVQRIIKLMLSPVGEVQRAAQALVRSAFDVDTRADCFRALLTNHPHAALEGLTDFLATFKQYANLAPEACNLAKSLVRCFTDIIEVLCQHPHGLLHQPAFIQASDPSSPALHLPVVWTMMSQAIALIFRRTPAWAKHFPNDEMVIWMRDALIFGREMHDEVQAFQSVARSLETLSPKRKTEIAENMLNDMQQVLTDLARWLRLTDEELLYQSYSLLEALFTYFRENGSAPNQDSVDRLKRYLADAKGADATSADATSAVPATNDRTRLSSAKLAQLDVLLSSLQEVVEVPPVTIDISDDDHDETPPPPPSSAPVKKAKDKRKEPEPAKPSKPSKAVKYSTTVAKPPLQKVAATSDKGFFSERDQKKLAGATTVAKFRKTSAPRASSKLPSRSSRSAPSSAAPSSSEDESDEGSGGALSRLPRSGSPKISKQKPRRQTKPMELVVSSSVSMEQQRAKAQAEREARDAREAQFRAYQRQNPNISNLIRTLLAWDYDHDGNQPPGPPLRTFSVPDRFKDAQDYVKAFEPLVLHELWAQIVNSKENRADSYSCLLGSKSTTDYWTKVDILIKDTIQQDWYLTENDVVLLRHSQDRTKSALAKVEESRKQHGVNAGLSATLKFCFDINKPDPGLQINTTWNISKVIRYANFGLQKKIFAQLSQV